MSEDRETSGARAAETPETVGVPGAPVEEAQASETEVLRAVQRSRDTVADEASAANAATDGAAAEDAPVAEETPAASAAANELDEAERSRREAISAVDTQLDMAPAPTVPAVAAAPTAPAPAYDDLPSAAPAAAGAAPATVPFGAALPPERDGEIRVSADHPMAALYTQTPMPPELRGNRGAGVLISLLSTVVFAALFLGVIAAWVSQYFPPSTFLSEGLLPWLTSLTFIIPVATFFVASVLLVLIVGRAGWWAYVLGGFFVAAAVWASAMLALGFFGTPYARPQEMLPGFSLGAHSLMDLVHRFGLTVPALGAAAVAREVTVWFGAWIGARGRRMKLRNAEALAEYEAAMVEVQATQP